MLFFLLQFVLLCFSSESNPPIENSVQLKQGGIYLNKELLGCGNNYFDEVVQSLVKYTSALMGLYDSLSEDEAMMLCYIFKSKNPELVDIIKDSLKKEISRNSDLKDCEVIIERRTKLEEKPNNVGVCN